MQLAVMARSIVVMAIFLGAHAASAQNPIPFWEFEVGNWIGAAYRTPDGGFSHCAIFGSYRSGISMAIVIDAEYDTQLAIGNPAWQLEIGELYEVGLSVDGRDFGRFKATPANRSALFIHVGQRPDVVDRLRRGYVLRIAAAHETFTFNLQDTYAALGKLKQCVDSARIRFGSPTNPFDEGGADGRAPGGDPGAAAEFLEAIAGILEAAGLEELRFVDPAESAYDNAALVWVEGALTGALFYLDEDASGAEAFTRSLIGGVASECTGTFGSQTKKGGRAGLTEISEFSLACEDADGSEFVAATVLATGEGTLIFVHFSSVDPVRLREVNDDLRRVIGIIWGT